MEIKGIELLIPTVLYVGFPSDHLSRKSISLLGVIGGFILILLFMAFLTCIRQKKIYQV